jgi:hypothetical protein
MPLTRVSYPPSSYKVLDVNGDTALNGGIAFGTTPLFPQSTTLSASLRVPHGVAPTNPVNGDIWTTTAGVFARVDNSTVGPFNRSEEINFVIIGSGELDPLNSNSIKHQYFLGSIASSKILRLPDTTTLRLGQSFLITNASNQNISVATFTSAAIGIVGAGTTSASVTFEFICIGNTTNAASAWAARVVAAQSQTGYSQFASQVFSSSPTIASPTINTINASATSTSASLWSGITTGNVEIANGINTGGITIGINVNSGGFINIGSSAHARTRVSGIRDADLDNAVRSAGFMGMPQRSTSTSGSFSAADAGQHVYVTATGTTQTIPANGTVAFPIGTTIVVVNGNGVSTLIAIATDTLRLAGSTSTGTRTLASNGMCTLLKINTTEWIASGNGLT